uniref:hypothetical protein n=1 Tax=Citrobacter amalonaticus TaxID=35703 RepID=UPI000B10329A
SKLTYGYARGHEAYAYVENIRKYQISLQGYLHSVWYAKNSSCSAETVANGNSRYSTLIH